MLLPFGVKDPKKKKNKKRKYCLYSNWGTCAMCPHVPDTCGDLCIISVFCLRHMPQIAKPSFGSPYSIPLMKAAEAVRWWNSWIAAVPARCKPPNCSVPQATNNVFARMMPIISLSVDPNKSDQEYWINLRAFISGFLNNALVPNPLKDFTGFLSFLYTNHGKLSPYTERDCILFFYQLALKYGHYSIIFLAPKFITDPYLYVSTLLRLRDTSHPFWQQFTSGSYELESLYGMYALYYIPGGYTTNPKAWAFRLSIGEIISDLTIECIVQSQNAEIYLETYHENTMQIIRKAPQVYTLSFLRQYLSVLKKIFANNESIVCKQAEDLLYIYSQSEMCYYYIMKFLINSQPKIIRSFHLLKIASSRGIHSQIDLILISELAHHTRPVHSLTTIAFFMTQSKIYHRSCRSLMIGIINRNQHDEEIRQFLINYIRKLFMSISLSILRGRYEERAVLTAETLSVMAKSQIGWLKRHVIACGMAAIAKGNVPEYLQRFIPAGKEKDAAYKEEYGRLMMTYVDLKVFPFEVGTMKLVDLREKPKLSALPKKKMRTVTRALRTIEKERQPRKSASKKRPMLKKKVVKRRVARTLD